MQGTLRHKQLIPFDLDGVLIDSRSNMAHAWQSVRDQVGVDVPFEAYFAEIGRPFADIMMRLQLWTQREAIETVFRRSSGERISQIAFYPGAEKMLAALQASNRKLGVVTSKDSVRTTLVLERLPIRFAVVMTPGNGLRGKPAPDTLLVAMAQCNVDPKDSIFVGDMDSDAAAASRANIGYVHAAWGYGTLPKQYSFAANNCDELLALLQ